MFYDKFLHIRHTIEMPLSLTFKSLLIHAAWPGLLAESYHSKFINIKYKHHAYFIWEIL